MKYGAKRQTWFKNNPRDLLEKLDQKNPTVSDEALMALHREEVNRHPVYWDAIHAYWFTNNLNSLRDEQAKAQELSFPEPELPLVTKAQIISTAAVDAIVTPLLPLIAVLRLSLDQPTPFNKPLRECTKKECNELGVAYARIAASLRHGEKVGERFESDDALRSYVQSYAPRA
jgi:hypothetical protein